MSSSIVANETRGIRNKNRGEEEDGERMEKGCEKKFRDPARKWGLRGGFSDLQCGTPIRDRDGLHCGAWRGSTG